MTIKIRKAKRADIDAIVKLNSGLTDYHHKIDPDYWSPSSKTRGPFRKFISGQIGKRNSLSLVAEDDGKAVGYFTGNILVPKPAVKIRKIGHLGHGFLLPEYRSQGIARKAGEMLVEWFKKKGIRLLELSVDSRNNVGVRAWEGLGFKEFMKKMKLEI